MSRNGTGRTDFVMDVEHAPLVVGMSIPPSENSLILPNAGQALQFLSVASELVNYSELAAIIAKGPRAKNLEQHPASDYLAALPKSKGPKEPGSDWNIG